MHEHPQNKIKITLERIFSSLMSFNPIWDGGGGGGGVKTTPPLAKILNNTKLNFSLNKI